MKTISSRLSIILAVLLTACMPSAAQQFPAQADTITPFELDEYLALHTGCLKIAIKDMQHYAVDKNGELTTAGYDKYVSILQKYPDHKIDLEILPNSGKLNYIQLTDSKSVVRLRLCEGIQFADISQCPNLQLIKIPRSLRGMKSLFSQAAEIEISGNDFSILPYIKTETVYNPDSPVKAENIFRTPWGSLITNDMQVITLDALWGCRRLIEDEATSTGNLKGTKFFYCDSMSRDIVFPDTMSYLPRSIQLKGKNAKLNSLIFPGKVKDLPSSLLAVSWVKKLKLPLQCSRMEEKYSDRWSFMGPYCEALRDCESIRLPDGITYIPNSMLMGCRKLKSIAIPPTVKRIGSHAFAGCEMLEEISLPEGLEEIGDYAFEGCTALKTINMPESVTSTGKGIFWACASLLEKPQNSCVTVDGQEFDYYGSHIVISNTEEVERQAFWGFTSLKSVTIKKKVTTINGGAFTGCTSLESLTIPDNMYINSKAGDDKTNRQSPFAYCSSLARLDLPANTIIDNHVMDLHNGENTEIILRQDKYMGQYGIFSTTDGEVHYKSGLNPKTTIHVPAVYVDQYKRNMQDCNRRHNTEYKYTFVPITE